MFKLQRYFIPEPDWKDNKVLIKGNDRHHITRVMRSNETDRIICNHSRGYAAICKITKINESYVEADVEKILNEDRELPVSITIAQGLPKGEKFDFVLQKGTELGAKAFIPFQAERSVVKWDHKKFIKKKQRFNKIIKEASEQSQRNKQPKITSMMTLPELLEESKRYDKLIFPYEEEAKGSDYQSFGSIVNKLRQDENVLVCIGPEGGFSPNEVALLKENNFLPVRIGPRILRTETAALYVLASISYHFEELRCT